MQEREYFRQVCLTMIHRNRRFNFAAVVDNHGKLLFGQSSAKNYAACIRGSGAIKLSSSNDALCFCGPKNEAYHFFNNCLVPVIRLSNNAERQTAANRAQKELIPLYDMISPVNRFVKIGIMPLNERKDRFLCVYTDHRDIETQVLAQS
jgi:hypothetical protein